MREYHLPVAKPGVLERVRKRIKRVTVLPSSAPRLQSERSLRAEERVSTHAGIREKFAVTLLGQVALLALIAAPAVARAQQSSPSQSRPDDDYTISVNVNMVVLRATALDHKGALVSGLGKNDFQVYEDGVLQQIKFFSHEDIPVTVGLVIDNSGSMRPKRADVIAAALAFARSSNPQDQMFVVNFNEKVSFGLPDNNPFTDQVAQLEVALFQNRSQW